MIPKFKDLEEKGRSEHKCVARVEFLDILLRVVKCPPANVYNDIFIDVFRDEWYAGMLQAVFDKKLIHNAMIINETFKPMEFITRVEMNIMVTNAHNIWVTSITKK